MSNPVWKFETANFTVQLKLEQDYGYQYDGDDEDGETQAKLDSGEYVAFDSTVEVIWHGIVIGSDSLGGSVYDSNETEEFYTAHRDSDFMTRNCSLMLKARGQNVAICHYFPDMVKSAIKDARANIRLRDWTMPAMRESA